MGLSPGHSQFQLVGPKVVTTNHISPKKGIVSNSPQTKERKVEKGKTKNQVGYFFCCPSINPSPFIWSLLSNPRSSLSLLPSSFNLTVAVPINLLLSFFPFQKSLLYISFLSRWPTTMNRWAFDFFCIDSSQLPLPSPLP